MIIDPPSPGLRNMAADEALLRSASLDKAFKPVLRLYGWAEPTLSLGYLQKSAPFRGFNLPLVRRITGGRAIVHDNEFTYAVIAGAGSPLYSKGITGCYSLISRAIVQTLRGFGIKAVFSRPSSPTAYKKSRACFASSARYEVLVEGKKIAGSAQRRIKGGLLQHGSIIFGINGALWVSIFGEQALVKAAALMDFCPLDRKLFQKGFVENLARELNASFTLSELTDFETEVKEGLVEQRYSKKEWNEGGEILSFPASGLI